MRDLIRGRAGIGTPEYILILAIALGLALLLFGKTLLRVLGEQIEGISSGVQLVDKKETANTTKKDGTASETGQKTSWNPFGNGGGSSEGSNNTSIDTGTFSTR